MITAIPVVLAAILIAVMFLIWKVHKMSEITDPLTADIATLTTVDQSAIALLNGLAGQIRDNANDPAARAASRIDSIEQNNTALAAAVTANTPAAPAPAPADSPAADQGADTLSGTAA